MRHPESPPLGLLRQPEQVSVLLHPFRRRLVGALLEKPDSAVGLARRLGEARQRLSYHLRILEEAGLITLAREVPRRGLTERVFRVVAEQFVMDPGVLEDLSPEPVERDRFSATYLVALASRTIRELASLMDRARGTRRRLATAALSTEVHLADPRDFNAFVEDLSRAVGAVVARYQSQGKGGRTFRVLAGVYPGNPEAEIRPDEPSKERI